MKLFLPTLATLLALCSLVPPAEARMKPVAAGKVESAAEKRERILEERKKEKREKERAEQEAKLAKERAAQEAAYAKQQAESEAAERAYHERRAREREEREARMKAEEEQAQAAERARLDMIKESIAQAGLPEDWRKQKGIVKVNELLKLKGPIVIFLRASEAQRYMTWLRSDAEAAGQYALDRVEEDCAFVLPAGTNVMVTQCEEDEEEVRIPVNVLFSVESTDGTYGYASNLILRQHRLPKKDSRRD